MDRKQNVAASFKEINKAYNAYDGVKEYFTEKYRNRNNSGLIEQDHVKDFQTLGVFDAGVLWTDEGPYKAQVDDRSAANAEISSKQFVLMDPEFRSGSKPYHESRFYTVSAEKGVRNITFDKMLDLVGGDDYKKPAPPKLGFFGTLRNAFSRVLGKPKAQKEYERKCEVYRALKCEYLEEKGIKGVPASKIDLNKREYAAIIDEIIPNENVKEKHAARRTLKTLAKSSDETVKKGAETIGNYLEKHDVDSKEYKDAAKAISNGINNNYAEVDLAKVEETCKDIAEKVKTSENAAVTEKYNEVKETFEHQANEIKAKSAEDDLKAQADKKLEEFKQSADKEVAKGAEYVEFFLMGRGLTSENKNKLYETLASMGSLAENRDKDIRIQKFEELCGDFYVMTLKKGAAMSPRNVMNKYITEYTGKEAAEKYAPSAPNVKESAVEESAAEPEKKEPEKKEPERPLTIAERKTRNAMNLLDFFESDTRYAMNPVSRGTQIVRNYINDPACSGPAKDAIVNYLESAARNHVHGDAMDQGVRDVFEDIFTDVCSEAYTNDKINGLKNAVESTFGGIVKYGSKKEIAEETAENVKTTQAEKTAEGRNAEKGNDETHVNINWDNVN